MLTKKHDIEELDDESKDNVTSLHESYSERMSMFWWDLYMATFNLIIMCAWTYIQNHISFSGGLNGKECEENQGGVAKCTPPRHK